MAKVLTLENALSNDRKPVKIDGESTGLLVGGKDVHIEGESSVGGDLTVDGNLKINGNHLTFGHGEIVHNNADDSIIVVSPLLWINGADHGTSAALVIYSDEDYDARINFFNGSGIKWTVGNDADDSDKLKFDAANTAVGGATKMTLDASGNLTLVGDLQVNGDDIKCDGAMNLEAEGGDITLDASGKIILDSSTGYFKAVNNGTEFSAANSSYAGMILGYTDIGLNETRVDLSLTTSYVVPTDEHSVAFTAPPSGNVEISMQVAFNSGGSGAGDLYAGLSSANATSGYSVLQDYHEEELVDQSGRYGWDTVVNSWTLTGLTAGTSYEYWVGFKSTSTTGTPTIEYGGEDTGHNPDFIMKATALPNKITT